MGVTRRYWGEVGLCAALAGLAALLGEPLLLVGAAGVGGAALARQYDFVRTVTVTASALDATQSVADERVGRGDATTVELDAELSRPSRVDLAVESSPPVGLSATDGDRRADLPAGTTSAAASYEVECRLAGSFAFDPPTADATDPAGRFTAAFRAGEGATVTVASRGAITPHVGRGGEAMSVMDGDHETDERGEGIETAEVRAYVPGDQLRRIDWNATARLGEPYVRESEAATRRTTAVLLDCRPSMARGPEGETKFDYARSVALRLFEYARSRDELVRSFAVGEEGLVARRTFEDGADAADFEDHLWSLDPTGGVPTDERGPDFSLADARRRTRALRGDESAYARTLGPYFAVPEPYVERVSGDPLYGVARTYLEGDDGATTAVIVTDDTNRTEVRETVKLARRRADRVVAMLTPTVLFDRDDAADVESTYDRYVDFERFRREMARLDRVSVFEVGPGDRLESLLARGRARRGRAGAGG
ncbi:DUF58 domain-containing protein [Halorussus sp. AFM4]|uniref:DUF58 domain-containing protein n=1 Tax=Halorussus sp. AFM4 TaxID=3421651 RepID=UPI003EBBA0AD